MKPLLYPDYQNTILNVSNSILKNYGCKVFAPTLDKLDRKLTKHKYRNIALILVDAMGVSTLSAYPESCRNLSPDKVATISSIFPPTTVAATTTVLTGKPPIQTAWIGWMQYVREVERNIVFFKNNDYYDEKKFMDYPISDTYVPVTYIYEILKKQNPDLNVREIFPAFREPEHDTFLKQAQSLVEEFEKPGRHFTYVYWDKLDWYMHEYGPSSQRASDTLALVDEGYAYLKQNIPPDSIVIVIADHGQVDVKPIKLYEYDKLWNTLSQLPSIESRAATFWVKDGKKKEFENEFLTNFRDKYILYKTEEVLAMNLFGYGEMHPRFRNFLGDYMAIAIDDSYFVFHPTDFYMKGQHAGLTAEEMQVPLIIYGKQ